MQPYVNYPGPMPEPFIPGGRIPPRVSPPLHALLASHVNSVEPILPEPKHKPLHPKRRANLLWRHHRRVMSQVLPPLPDNLLDELEQRAGKDPTAVVSDGLEV